MNRINQRIARTALLALLLLNSAPALFANVPAENTTTAEGKTHSALATTPTPATVAPVTTEPSITTHETNETAPAVPAEAEAAATEATHSETAAPETTAPAPALPTAPLTTPVPMPNQPDQAELQAIGREVLNLLQNRFVESFVESYYVRADDYLYFLDTNLPPAQASYLKAELSGAAHNRQLLQQSAKNFLNWSDQMLLGFSGDEVAVEVPLAGLHFLSRRILDRPTRNGRSAPSIQDLAIYITRGTNNSDGGRFQVVIHDLVRFPEGWRILSSPTGNALEWRDIPAAVLAQPERRDAVIAWKSAAGHALTDQDDPALLALGENLLAFLRSGDTNLFLQKLAVVPDDFLYGLKTESLPLAQQEAIGAQFRMQAGDFLEQAVRMQQRLAHTGANLTNAVFTLKSARIEKTAAPMGKNLVGNHYQLTFSLRTDAQAENGIPLAGDYVIGTELVIKSLGSWRLAGRLTWEQYPTGLFAPKSANPTQAKSAGESSTAPESIHESTTAPEAGHKPAAEPKPESEHKSESAHE